MKRIYTFIYLIGIIFLNSLNTTAAPVYTNLSIPYLILANQGTPNTLDIDIDGNTDAEFRIINDYNPLTQTGNMRVELMGGQSPDVVVDASGKIACLQNYTAIGFSSNFSQQAIASQIILYDSTYQSWRTNEDRNIGFRFEIGQDSFYGWIRMHMDTSNYSLLVTGWAYEDIPHANIDAGEVFVTAIDVYNVDNQYYIDMPGAYLQLKTSILPIEATNQGVTWTTSNSSIATVSSNGWIYALDDGVVAIRATANDGSGSFEEELITITNQTIPVMVTGVQISTISGNNFINTDAGTLQMQASITPTDATNPYVLWSVSDSTIATIHQLTGLLQAQNNGEIWVYATSNDGTNITDSMRIYINNQAIVLATSITVLGENGQNTITLANASLQMEAFVFPTTATITDVVWSVDNPNLAYISTDGVLYAQSDGIVEVRALATDGSGVSGTKAILIANQPVSTNRTIDENLISIYPNPSRYFTYVQLNKPYLVHTWQILDIKGRVCLKGTPSTYTQRLEIPVQQLPKSVYLLQIYLDECNKPILKSIIVE
ncbi:MAG: Ig-like domain-containing protein [Saprospiraceae bacterium]|nr:Ig-like domain-containing protein [Saprospiraceae bacterium]